MFDRRALTLAIAALALFGLPPNRASAASRTNDTVPLSLREAIRTALAHDFAYREAQAGVAAAWGRVREARAAGLPSLVVADTYQYVNPVARLTTPFGSLPFSTTSATNVPLAAVQYTLFDGGGDAAQAGMALDALAAAEGRADEARGAVIFGVSAAYFQLAGAVQMRAVARTAVAVARAHVEEARELVAAGQLPRASLLRAQAALAEQELSEIQADDAVTSDRLNLAQMLGAPPETRYLPTDTLSAPPPAFDLATLVRSALRSRGSYQAALAAVEEARHALAAARSGIFPRIVASIADGNTQPAVTSGFHNQFSVMLSAVWALFDGGATAGRIASARAGIEQAELELARRREAIEIEVRDALLGVQEAQASVTAAEKYVSYADESLRLAQVRYRNGIATELEMHDAELADRSAHDALIQAWVAVQSAVARLRFAAGLP